MTYEKLDEGVSGYSEAKLINDGTGISRYCSVLHTDCAI